LVSYFYHFSKISYEFSKSNRKRKIESMNSNGLKPARYGPYPGETCPRAPALSNLHRDPGDLKKPIKSPVHYLLVSLTFTPRPLPFCFFAVLSPRWWTATSVSPTSLYRPENAMTGALVRLTPNSTYSDHNPSINCKIPAHNRSVHGGDGNRR
jgi:hypothetical protein